MNPGDKSAIPTKKKVETKGLSSQEIKSGRKPSPKAVMYVDGLMQGKTKKKAALDAGYSMNTALNATADIEKSKPVQQLMEEAGLTNTYIIGKLKQGMEADKPFGKFGDIHPDYATQHKFMETSMKLKGILKEDTPQQTNTQINIIANSEEIKKINDSFVEFLHHKLGGK